MPELPDVETFKRYIKATALHKRIESIRCVDPRILEGLSVSTLRRHAVGCRIESARRHGKHLFAELDGDAWLVLHFGMTGFVRYYKGEDAPEEVGHIRTRFDFDNGYHLAFDCQRLFGSIALTEEPGRYVADKELGPDALTIGEQLFAERLRTRRSAIKTALMDQRLIAGIGNVYSDEIVFQARLDPRISTRELDDGHVAELHRVMGHVLRSAIDAKADPERMPKLWLTPRRGEAEPTCPRCGSPLRREEVAQRTSYLCPQCQVRNLQHVRAQSREEASR